MSLLRTFLLRRAFSTAPRALSNANLSRGEPGYHAQGSTDTAPGHPITTLYPHGAPADQPDPSTIADAPVTPFASTLAAVDGESGPEEAALEALVRHDPVPRNAPIASHIGEEFDTHMEHVKRIVYKPADVSIASLLPWAPTIPCGEIGNSAALLKAIKRHEKRTFPNMIKQYKAKHKNKKPRLLWLQAKRQVVRLRLMKHVVTGVAGGTRNIRTGDNILAKVQRATAGQVGAKNMLSSVKGVLKNIKDQKKKLELAKQKAAEDKKKKQALPAAKKQLGKQQAKRK